MGDTTGRGPLRSVCRAAAQSADPGDQQRCGARRALADRTRLQGLEHPRTLAALHLTVEVAYGLGKLEEAIATAQQLIELRERVLGRSEHPFVVGNRERLADWRAEAEA